MKKSSIFQKFLFYLICGCVLTSSLAVFVYLGTGASVHARRIADEMLPRAESMARLAERLQSGQVSYDSFIDFAIKNQQGTRVFIFDENADLIAFTSDSIGTESGSAVITSAIVSDSILASGKKVVSTGEELISTKWLSQDGIVVGVAIQDNMQRVIGAIIMTRPTFEVYSSLMGFVRALILSSVIASAGMAIPAYFISRRMTYPISSMIRASVAMAGGDFSVHADESREDELGQLGLALNHFPTGTANINDLILAKEPLHVILDGLGWRDCAGSRPNIITITRPPALFGVCCQRGKRRQSRRFCRSANWRAGAGRSPWAGRGERKLLMLVSLSQETSEEAPGTVIVAQDVTASERLEQTRRDYVANVSHELRTPISSIRSLAETLNDGLVKKEEDRSRYYGYILRESLRLTRLINDLLELSRLQSGAVALERVVPLDGCDEVTEQMRLVASYSGIRIKTDWHCARPLNVHSNRDRIEQVLIALVDNAIKFASDEGTITLDVSLSGDEKRAIIAIMNTGHIDEKHLPHLFERFYKADAAHSDGGTGLGLAIVQEVLMHLGESIEARNEDENAVFRFTIGL